MSDSSSEDSFLNPELKLEDVRDKDGSNTCRGRGRETASGRGYNAERLASAVLNEGGVFLATSFDPWYDACTICPDELVYRTEVKSCVDRYQTATGEEGGYGQFRIWRPHHIRLVIKDEFWPRDVRRGIYFFVVYTVEDSIEKEVGKLVAPVQMVDDVLNTWSSGDHVTMGDKKDRQISWRLLLKKLGVSRERFENELIINLLEE